MCCLPSGIGVAVGPGPPARAADVAGVGVAVYCPQVLELLCAVCCPQVLELLWDLAHLPVLPTSLVQQALDEHLAILNDSFVVKEATKKSYVIKCVDDIKEVCCQVHTCTLMYRQTVEQTRIQLPIPVPPVSCHCPLNCV